MVGKTKGVKSLGKVEHRVEEEAGVGGRVQGVTAEHQAVQADHRR